MNKLQISFLRNCCYYRLRAQSPECQQSCHQTAGSLDFERELNFDGDDDCDIYWRHCSKKNANIKTDGQRTLHLLQISSTAKFAAKLNPII